MRVLPRLLSSGTDSSLSTLTPVLGRRDVTLHDTGGAVEDKFPARQRKKAPIAVRLKKAAASLPLLLLLDPRVHGLGRDSKTNRSYPNGPRASIEFSSGKEPIAPAGRRHLARSTQVSIPSASTTAIALGTLTAIQGGQVFSRPRCENRPFMKWKATPSMIPAKTL